ncbi:DUF2905 domain-containing protein [Desulfonatronum thiodismutans]|uniref:DUF2905 domain-containing protein n=1 Tax=Desulfonatronum thiodismutans TaxID=159290 RepID=UPI0004ABE271|nr:DUF2905 domain-containing protein [Desulfonatronum thiodismutans]
MPRLLIIIGFLCIAIGLIWSYAPWMLNWFGKLPGDINIKSERSRVFIPITSMIIISVVVSVLINLFRK